MSYKPIVNMRLDCKTDINAFYKNLPSTDFSTVSEDRIKELKDLAPIVYEVEVLHKDPDRELTVKYSRLMNRLRMNMKSFNLKSSSEMYLLYMLAVDPDMTSLIYLSECDKIEDLKKKMVSKFGFFDISLLKIEKIYFKNLMEKQSKKMLREEMNRRAYK